MKVGDRYLTNNGEWLTVVEYVNYDKVKFQFDDKYGYSEYCSKDHIENGILKNPYTPRLFGVGFIGAGKYKSKDGATRLGFKSLPTYSAWVNMLSRCYDPNYINPKLYNNVIVNDSWHNYQVFAEWHTNALEKVKWVGRICLDKDILSNNHEYSESNCCLVPVAINSSVAKLHNISTSTGVIKFINHYRVVPSCSTERTKYQTELDAHLAYVSTKSEKIRTLALEYKDSLNPRAFDALMTRDFRHKFSPLFPMVD